MNHTLLYAVIATAFALIAACIDVKTRKIPNFLTFALLPLGVILHFMLGGSGDGFKAILSALIAGAVFLVFHIAGGMGAGDVKLITGLAACYGLTNMPYLLIFTSLAGGVMALSTAVKHGRVRETVSNIGTLASHHAQAGLAPHTELHLGNRGTLRLPYAVAIAAGCVLTNLISLGHA